MERFLVNHAEWTRREDLNKPQSMFCDFFHSKGNCFEVNNKDFHLQVNPLLYVQNRVKQFNAIPGEGF